MCRTLPKTRASSWFRVTLPVCDRWTCVCIYKKDSEPVFLSICKQSACSQNLCLNSHNFVRNNRFVCRSMFVITISEVDGRTLTWTMQNEGLNTVLQSSVLNEICSAQRVCLHCMQSKKYPSQFENLCAVLKPAL